jgi:hypothetical protein
MDLLKLIALDEEDLKVVSAHLQDAVLRVADMAFLPRERRFAVLLNRFDWLSAETKAAQEGFRRQRCGLRFEKVLNAQIKNISLQRRSDALELLAIDFEEHNPPGGYITLTFAGGGAVRLEVDCIEAELRDLGLVWKTGKKPIHPDDQSETKTAS